MEDKRIYSLNRLAWLISKDIPINYYLDCNNKLYGIVNQDISKELQEYFANVDLHRFISSFKELKNKMRELKNKNNN